MQFSDLLKVLKSLGKSFMSVEPLLFCVGNIVKRILHIVREEYNKFPNLESFSQQSSDNKKKRMMKRKKKRSKKSMKQGRGRGEGRGVQGLMEYSGGGGGQ